MILFVAMMNLPAVSGAVMLARVVAITIALGLWYLTQWLIGQRSAADCGSGVIYDRIHHVTRLYHQRLLKHPKIANGWLIGSSLVIDLLGAFVLVLAIVGATFQPFVGLFIVFGLRQLCQRWCPLPAPQGMIWRDPGFPTVLVTYGTSNDLFFSGHTAIAVYGASCLMATLGGPWGIALGLFVIVFEIVTVLVLRAHYTMDVYAGLMTALFVYQLSWKLAPAVDQWISSVVSKA